MNSLHPRLLACLLVAVAASAPLAQAQKTPASPDPAVVEEMDEYASVQISDPLEPMNRAIFKFNDRLYTYVLRPISKGYVAFKLQTMPERLELPQGTIESTLLPHGGINTIGLIFTERSSGKKFTYYTDCKRVTREAVALAKGSAVVVLDGLRPDAHPTHMSISEAVEAAGEIGAPRTYLTHLTHLTGHAEWADKLPPGVEFAYDGLRLSL